MGAGSPYVSVNGVQYTYDRSAATTKVYVDSLVIQDREGETPNTCQFTAAGFTPSVGQAVVVTLASAGGTKQFGGVIISVDDHYLSKPANQAFHVSCIDYTWLLNRRKVIKKYTAQSATTIAQDIISTYCSGFTSTNVAASLATIDEITFTNVDVTEALTRLAKRIGGYWYCDYDKDLHFFLSETGSNPTDLTSSHSSLTDFQVTRDLSQVVTRVYVEGGGANVATAVAVGETILPVQDGTWYNAAGGVVVVGPQRLTYTGRSLGTGGSLVGPGAAPSAGPSAIVQDGSGVETGAHSYAATFITAAGESIASPLTTLTVGTHAAPVTGPAPGTATVGSGPDDGAHDYQVTFINAAGETTPGPTGGSITTSSPLISAPSTAPTVTETGDGAPGSYQATANYKFKITFVTALGETTPGPEVSHTVAVTGKLTIGSIPLGASGTTARKIYRNVAGAGHKFIKTINDNTTTSYLSDRLEADGAVPPVTNTAGVAYHVVPLTGIAIGPTGITSRKVYRRFNATGTYKLVTTIANNTATTFSDTVTNASLGANAPSSNTATANQVALSSIPIGGATVTSRKIYRTVAAGSQLKLLTTIADNTTTTYTDSTADASLGANVPTSDTSGLTQPNGQVIAGSTTLVVASAGAFASAGGWAVIGNGQQVIRYTGKTGASLTGIPASGVGAITASVGYNSTVTPSPDLTGIPASSTGSVLYAIVKSEPANLLAQVDDTAAQTTLAALFGSGDGIQEDYIQDNRLSYAEALARGTAHITLRKDVQVSIQYQCRDILTRSGRTIHVNLPAPQSLTADFKIQDVTISKFPAPASVTQYPTFMVKASSTRYTLEDLLRQRIAA